MPPLNFEPFEHRYSLDGRRKPSVTQCLRSIVDYGAVDKAILEYARERGDAVHKACQFLDEGTLDLSTVGEVVEPYLLAWTRFKHLARPVWTHIEAPMYSHLMDVAGTPDRVGTLEGFKGSPVAVVDIKTTAQIYAWTPIQLAGYAAILWDNGAAVQQRYAVQLKRNGQFALHRFDKPGDLAVFKALAAEENERIALGLDY